jgi:hypothetical protein
LDWFLEVGVCFFFFLFSSEVGTTDIWQKSDATLAPIHFF